MLFEEIKGVDLNTGFMALAGLLPVHQFTEDVREMLRGWVGIDHSSGERRRKVCEQIYQATKQVFPAGAIVGDRWFADGASGAAAEKIIGWGGPDSEFEWLADGSQRIPATKLGITTALAHFLVDPARVMPPQQPKAYRATDQEQGIYLLDLSLRGRRFAFAVFLHRGHQREAADAIAIGLCTLATPALNNDHFRYISEKATAFTFPSPNIEFEIGNYKQVVDALRRLGDGWCKSIAKLLEVEEVHLLVEDQDRATFVVLGSNVEAGAPCFDCHPFGRHFFSSDWHEFANLDDFGQWCTVAKASPSKLPQSAAAASGPIVFCVDTATGLRYGLVLIGRDIDKVWMSDERRCSKMPDSRKSRVLSVARLMFGQMGLQLKLAMSQWRNGVRFTGLVKTPSLNDACEVVRSKFGADLVEIIGHLPFAVYRRASSDSVRVREETAWLDEATLFPESPLSWKTLPIGAFVDWVNPGLKAGNMFIVPISPERGLLMVVAGLPGWLDTAHKGQTARPTSVPEQIRAVLEEAATSLGDHPLFNTDSKQSTTFRSWVNRVIKMPSPRAVARRSLGIVNSTLVPKQEELLSRLYVKKSMLSRAILDIEKVDSSLAALLRRP